MLYPAIVVVVLAAAFMASRAIAAPSAPRAGLNLWDDLQPDNEPDQLPNVIEEAVIAMNPMNSAPAAVPSDQAATNVRAFLDTIAYSEGTAGYPDNGYRTHFGGSQFDSYADHPRVVINASGYSSSAAGRYQILRKTWDTLQRRLNLPDFSPDSQDAACLELVRERGALGDVQAGRFAVAVRKCAPIWASLPGAGYNQPERKLTQLQTAFAAAGGTVEA